MRNTSCRWSLLSLLLLGGSVAACSSAATEDPVDGKGAGGTGGAPATGSGGMASPVGTGGAGLITIAGSGGAVPSGGEPAQTGTGGGSVATGGSPASGGSQGGGGKVVSTGGSAGGGNGSGTDAGVDAVKPVVDGGGGTDVNQAGLPNITLHLAGDSTVMTYTQPTATADEGWGQELGQYFISKVTINNQAIGGASVASFHTGRWGNIAGSLKAGDYVMAAFGANDSGSVAGRHVDPPAFQALFAQMADEVKAKQATFIPVTPSALREWTGTMEGNTRLGPYAAATIAAGAAKGLLVDDLNARSVEFLNMIGPTGAMQYYKGVDKAHFTKMGATQMAQFVAQELQRIGSPLAAYLK